MFQRDGEIVENDRLQLLMVAIEAVDHRAGDVGDLEDVFTGGFLQAQNQRRLRIVVTALGSVGPAFDNIGDIGQPQD